MCRWRIWKFGLSRLSGDLRDPSFPEEYREVCRELRENLNFLAANVDVSLVLYEQHLQRTRELLVELNAAINGNVAVD